MIETKTLNNEKILQLNSKEKLISLREKVIKLGEELGDMQAAMLYFTREDYISETYDAFNISVALYHSVKGYPEDENFLTTLNLAIDKTSSSNKLVSVIPIFYGKICASLLFIEDSQIKSRNVKFKDLEAYLLELILLLASQLKYIDEDYIDFEAIVNEKLYKWEIKQQEYI